MSHNLENLTYKQLEALALQIEFQLRKRGIKENDYVAILLDRSALYIASLIAVLRVGAAFVPIDPDYPKDRITYILKDCSAKTIITTEKLQGKIEHEQEKLLFPNNNLASSNNAYNLKRTPITNPNSVAYLIYTSG